LLRILENNIGQHRDMTPEEPLEYVDTIDEDLKKIKEETIKLTERLSNEDKKIEAIYSYILNRLYYDEKSRKARKAGQPNPKAHN
jgi:hypothetical protein